MEKQKKAVTIRTEQKDNILSQNYDKVQKQQEQLDLDREVDDDLKQIVVEKKVEEDQNDGEQIVNKSEQKVEKDDMNKWTLVDKPFPQMSQWDMKQVHFAFISAYGELEQHDDNKYDIEQVYYKQDGKYQYYYNGILLNGKMNGIGKYYEGQITKQLKPWDTRYPTPGHYYQGGFKEDRKDGEGYRVDVYFTRQLSGSVYMGEFRNDKKKGFGKQANCGSYKDDGNKYVGQWDDDMRNGDGEMIYKNGSKYIGQYKNDNMHGYGYYVDSDNNKYMGQFQQDKYDGQGSIIYNDGSMFKGSFKAGQREGNGWLIYQNNKSIKGIWLDDQLYQNQLNDNVSCFE